VHHKAVAKQAVKVSSLTTFARGQHYLALQQAIIQLFVSLPFAARRHW